MKVGDKVFTYSSYLQRNTPTILTIIRETPKRWVTDNNVQWHKSNLQKVGANVWSGYETLLELTSERLEEYESWKKETARQGLWRRLTALPTPNISYQRLEEIYRELQNITD